MSLPKALLVTPFVKVLSWPVRWFHEVDHPVYLIEGNILTAELYNHRCIPVSPASLLNKSLNVVKITAYTY